MVLELELDEVRDEVRDGRANERRRSNQRGCTGAEATRTSCDLTGFEQL